MRTKKILIALLAFLGCLAVCSAAEQLALVESARKQIGVTVLYSPAYVALSYPGGDVPAHTGVCTDVVVRAFRDSLGIDLQRRVHEDMRADFSAYPKRWGLRRPDKNIDHRRVPNLMRFLERKGKVLELSKLPNDYLPGHVVAWDLGKGVLHIGIVSDQRNDAGVPLILHNIGSGAAQEDILFRYKIIGHYAYPPDRAGAG